MNEDGFFVKNKVKYWLKPNSGRSFQIVNRATDQHIIFYSSLNCSSFATHNVNPNPAIETGANIQYAITT
jgi:hypothetical protein